MKKFYIVLIFIILLSCTKLSKANGNTTNSVFNFQTKTVMLNSGYNMPINGIGTFQLIGNECYNSVLHALKNGVRLIDTAYIYGNEAQVARAVKDSGVDRKEIFITTKLYTSQFSNPEEAINLALRTLDTDYIDLMLLHHPGNNDIKAYKAMEKAVKEGKIRSIGLSNWYKEDLEKLLSQIEIMPAVIQNETHPYFQDDDMNKYIQNLGIAVEAWYPLGGRGRVRELLNDEIIKNIASNHNKSSAQIILRWNLQRNIIVIPGSSNLNHIKENNELYDFELSEAEMQSIYKLDKNKKHSSYGARN